MLVLDRVFEKQGIQIPKSLIGTNVIHMPTVKTHVFTGTTGAMKNAFGGLLNLNRHWTHSVIHETLVDLLRIQKEIHPGMFAVMDGTIAGDGPGPRCMRPHVKNYILASDDCVAIDAIAAKLMGFDPMTDLKFIRLAHENGLGVGRPEEIEIVGDDIQSVNFGFRGSLNENTFALRGPEAHLLGPAQVTGELPAALADRAVELRGLAALPRRLLVSGQRQAARAQHHGDAVGPFVPRVRKRQDVEQRKVGRGTDAALIHPAAFAARMQPRGAGQMSRRTALLLVDVQENMFDPAHPVADAAHLLQRFLELLDRAHSARMLTVFVRNCGGPNDPDQQGTPGWELHIALQPGEGDLVFDKTTPDAFESTPLADELKSRGIARVVIAGLQSEFCIRATSLGALQRGLRRDAGLGWAQHVRRRRPDGAGDQRRRERGTRRPGEAREFLPALARLRGAAGLAPAPVRISCLPDGSKCPLS